MKSSPIEVLDLLQDKNVKSVEVVDFQDLLNLQEELRKREIQIVNIVLPPWDGIRDFVYYKKVLDSYIKHTNVKSYVIQSLPKSFHGDNIRESIEVLSQLISEISHYLKELNIKLGYHPFTHDLIKRPEESNLNLILKHDYPDNFGIQLDTYWLYENSVSPKECSSWPIHSIHIVERDIHDQNTRIGTIYNKCLRYIQEFASHEGILWILEHESEEDSDFYDDMASLSHTLEAIDEWPSTVSSKTKGDKSESSLPPIKSLFSRRLYSYNEEALTQSTFESEQQHAFTEYLFGEDDLEVIHPDDVRLNFYVSDRPEIKSDFHFENDMFSAFWPIVPNRKDKIISIKGSAGSGKSTFLRFFFQYYLPFKNVLERKNCSTESPWHLIHYKSFLNHIVIYVNLRWESPPENFTNYVFDKAIESLIQLCNKRGISVTSSSIKLEPNKRFLDYIDRLSQYKISLVLDNADQMDKKSQTILYKLSTDLNCLWRVIIPIRPETESYVDARINPVPKKYVLDLASVDMDKVLSKRAEWLKKIVTESNKLTYQKIRVSYEEDGITKSAREQHNLKPAFESAEFLHECMSSALTEVLGNNTDVNKKARKIVKLLINDSLRRAININPKIAFSKTFAFRKSAGYISAFYYLDGFIRGSKNVFSESNNIIVTNWFNLSRSKEWTPEALFIGLHILQLLGKRKSWIEIYNSLIQIGYSPKITNECLDVLQHKEIVRGYDQYYEIVENIVDGHGLLLYRRSYFDNMAIHASNWWDNIPSISFTRPITDNFLERVSGVVAFFELLWKSEVLIYKLPENNTNFKDFNETINKMEFVPITNQLCSSYLSTLNYLVRNYENIKQNVHSDRVLWERTRGKLETIIKQSSNYNNFCPYRTTKARNKNWNKLSEDLK